MADSNRVISSQVEVLNEPVVTLDRSPSLALVKRKRPANPFARWLGWLFLVLLAGPLLLIAYQIQPFSYYLDIGPGSDSTYVAQFYAPESNPQFDYRWSQTDSYINLYQTGTPYQLSFRAFTANPSQEKVELRVIANGQELGRVQVGSQPEVFTLRSSRLSWGPEDLTLTFRPTSTFAEPVKNGRTRLGVALDWVQVEPYRNRLGLIIPPPFQGLWWLLVVLWPLILTRLLGIKLAGWRRYLLPGFNLLLISALLIIPATFPQMHTDWLLSGVQLGLIELGALVGWQLVGRWRQRELAQPKPGKAALWLLLAGLACFYLASAKGRLSYGDDQIMEGVTAAMVAGQPAAPLTHFLPEPSTVVFSKYGIGFSLVGVPFYVLGKWAADLFPFMFSQENGTAGLAVYILLFTNICLTVASVGLFHWLLRLLGFGRRSALATTALYGLGTMAWHYARTFMSEPLVAFCILFALVSGLKYLHNGSWRWAAWGGFMLGLAIAARLPNLALVPIFGLYLLWCWWERTGQLKQGMNGAVLKSLLIPAVVWLAGIAFWLAIIGWYNFARFGSPFTTGYESEGFTTPFLTGFWGLVFSPGKSVFFYNPVLFLGLFGWPFVFKALRSFAVLSLGIIGVYLVLYSMWSEWWGGGVWGPRFLLPVVPLLLWPAAYLFAFLDDPEKRTRSWRFVLKISLSGLVFLLSLGVQFISVMIDSQIYVAQYGRQPELFDRAINNPVDSPIIVELKLWFEQTRPDLAFRFYHETPFARWVELVQNAAWLLFLGSIILALGLWLKNLARNTPAGQD